MIEPDSVVVVGNGAAVFEPAQPIVCSKMTCTFLFGSEIMKETRTEFYNLRLYLMRLIYFKSDRIFYIRERVLFSNLKYWDYYMSLDSLDYRIIS